MTLFLPLYWQVNQKMILTLTASIMYWSLQQPVYDSDSSSAASFSRGTSPEPVAEEATSPASVSTSDALATSANGCPSSTNGNSYPSAAASRDKPPTPSASGDDVSIVSELSQLTMDDTASDTVISASADDQVSDTATSALAPESDEAQLASE